MKKDGNNTKFHGTNSPWIHILQDLLSPAQSWIMDSRISRNDLKFGCIHKILDIDSGFHDRFNKQYPWHQYDSEKASGYGNAANESFRILASNIT